MAIEYEPVTINVPKSVMDLLRFSASVLEQTPKEWLEYAVMDEVRAGLDANEFLPNAFALVKKFNLNPTLEELIGDPIKP